MGRPPRERQPHCEQRGLGLHPGQHHPQIMEVDLGFSAGPIRLRHEPRLQRPARFRGDLRAPLADMITHRRIRQPGRIVFIDQTRQNPSGGVTLLLRGVQIRAQHLINSGLERLKPRCHPRRNFACRRHRRGQRLTHRAPVHPMLIGQRPDRQPLKPMIPADRRELLHLRPHPPDPHLHHHAIQAIRNARDHRQVGPIHVVITNAACREDGAKSDRQNSTPATTQVEPLQTVHPGPSQAVTATAWGQLGCRR